MATRIEWTKVTRDLEGVYLAFRASIGSVLATARKDPKKNRRARPLQIRAISPIDFTLLADLERKKNLAYLNTTKNQFR